MSDLLLNKQNNKSVKEANLSKTKSKSQVFPIKPLLFFVVLGFVIGLSIKNDNLFLIELLISGGILFLIFVVHLLSQKEVSTKEFK